MTAVTPKVMRKKIFFGIFILTAMIFSNKSFAGEAYVSYDDGKGYFLVATSPGDTTDKTVVVFKDGPHVGTQDTVWSKDIFAKEGSEGKFKIGTAVYVNLDVWSGRAQIIGFSPEHFAMVQAMDGDLSRRAVVGLGQLLPLEGSFKGFTVGQEIFAGYQKEKGSPTEIVKNKIASYRDSGVVGESEKGIFTFPVSDIFKFEGCSKSHFLCVGQNYYSSKLKTILKLKAYNDDGDTYEIWEGSKLQTQEFVETEDSLASTEAGVCTSGICVGESYLNAFNNYSEVKVEAISKDNTIYVSTKSNPAEISPFAAVPYGLVKASEKQTSLNGINLGQKVMLIDREQQKAFPSRLVGISRDQRPIIILDNKISEYPGDVVRGEGCDTSKKKCVGQRYFINSNGALGRIVGVQNNGLFVMEYVKNLENSEDSKTYWWDVNGTDLRRGGCPGGICDEKIFKYR